MTKTLDYKEKQGSTHIALEIKWLEQASCFIPISIKDYTFGAIYFLLNMKKTHNILEPFRND